MAADGGRWVGLAAFVAVGLALGWVATKRERGSDRPSAAPVAELVGRAAQTAARGLAQALGVSEVDEARLGAYLGEPAGGVGGRGRCRRSPAATRSSGVPTSSANWCSVTARNWRRLVT